MLELDHVSLTRINGQTCLSCVRISGRTWHQPAVQIMHPQETSPFKPRTADMTSRTRWNSHLSRILYPMPQLGKCGCNSGATPSRALVMYVQTPRASALDSHRGAP